MKNNTFTLNSAGRLYVELVEHLTSFSQKNINICVATNEGRHLNFRVNDFKRTVLSLLLNPSEYRTYMRILRELQWIVCEEGRLTNSQRIKGKTMRVITVDKQKFELIKSLTAMKE